MQGISWLTEEVLALQELCSMELVESSFLTIKLVLILLPFENEWCARNSDYTPVFHNSLAFYVV